MPNDYAQNKVTIIGGGIIGFMEVYFAYLKAQKKNERLRATIYEKNERFDQTTAAKIAPSLTPDEILSVVPRGTLLVEKLKDLFSVPGGVRVNDVEGINESAAAKEFIRAVEEYSKDEAGHLARTEALLTLGKLSMDLWEDIYQNGDDELKKIMRDSNYNPCRETDKKVLQEGYRIDLIQRIPDAAQRAKDMMNDYDKLGYHHCEILSPAEVMKRDISLVDFCKTNSIELNGELVWKSDAVALWRPGGCLHVATFLPKFSTYLSKVMGQYTSNVSHQDKDNFRIKFNREVSNVSTTENGSGSRVNGLFFSNFKKESHHHTYDNHEYVFCPGESVGTLRKFGFNEPAYAIFAGAALRLSFRVSDDMLEKYKSFNHYMEVHQQGVVLAWQAGKRGPELSIAVAGTKAFYGDQVPTAEQDFAKNRNLLQLNMINNVLPELISAALGRNTHGQELTEADLQQLVSSGKAIRGVGSRAVAYDGFPTLGRVYQNGVPVANARVTTGLGSGGVSFAPAAVQASQSVDTSGDHPVLAYASSKRKPQ
jgi:glycine/D-amino acid oxidase-like deaminating enzyme